MGLGLSISRTIAQNHAGELTVDPGGDGRGARFTCDCRSCRAENARRTRRGAMAIERSRQDERREWPAHSGMHPADGRRGADWRRVHMGQAGQMDQDVFIVDDDGAVRDALRLVFEMEGFRVQAFPDGASFLAAAALAHAGRRGAGRAHAGPLRPGGAAGTRASLRRAGVHDLRPGRHPDGGRGHPAGAHDFIEKPFDADTVVHARARRHRGARPQGSAQQLRRHDPGRVLGRGAADAARARGARADRARRVEQGSRPPARHQPAHHRGARARIMEKLGRPQHRRPGAHRLLGRAPELGAGGPRGGPIRTGPKPVSAENLQPVRKATDGVCAFLSQYVFDSDQGCEVSCAGPARPACGSLL